MLIEHLFRRNAADIMGGFWRVTSEFPITVLDEVSELVASNSKAHLLADSLPGYNPHSGEQLVQSAGYVRCMLDTWIMSESSGATLDCLFRAMHRVGLFHTLRRAIEHRIECQPLPTGNTGFSPLAKDLLIALSAFRDRSR